LPNGTKSMRPIQSEGSAADEVHANGKA